MPLEQTVKTLIVEIGKKDYVTLLMPGTKKIALKKLAKSYGGKGLPWLTLKRQSV